MPQKVFGAFYNVFNVDLMSRLQKNKNSRCLFEIIHIIRFEMHMARPDKSENSFETVLGFWFQKKIYYCMRIIITCGLYIFYPIFSAVYNQKWLILRSKQGNLGLKSAVYYKERVILARVQ